MNPDEIFKQFFGESFPGFGEGGFGSNGPKQGWHGEGHGGGDVFDDFHSQMQQHMEEMDRQMREVFRIFHIPEDGSGIPAIPGGHEGRSPQSKSNPREHMLKEDQRTPEPIPDSPKSSEPPGFSSPGSNFGLLSDWIDQFTKLPRWNRVHPEERVDRDLDAKSPSSAEIADIFKKKGEEPNMQVLPSHPFSFRGNSVSIQTVVGADGVVEERRTVRDSSGREETTITRRKGDSSHSVTTIRESDGSEERHETFNNMEKDKLPEFQQHLEEPNITDQELPVKSPLRRGGGILSDEHRGIFRKFFGF